MTDASAAHLCVTPSSARAHVGVARRDITPPIGIYARMWGAAKHDVSEGTHRPLSATAMAIRGGETGDPLVLCSVDLALLGDLGGDSDERRIMTPMLQSLGLDRRRVMVNCTHTHAAPWAASSRESMPGGEKIGPYLERVGEALLEAAREALATAQPATFTWATGRCDLATVRDLPDPDASRARVVCGYNPKVKADDTLLVGRVTRDADGSVLATVVNYACHPTTLAWDNRLISPDYIGAMRELIEREAGGTCLFLQGGSGELAPAHQYVGDARVADRHGRRLGYAALSALESMLPPGQRLAFAGVMESGAPLAVWKPEPFDPPTVVEASGFDVTLPLKPMPAVHELQRQIDEAPDRTMKERLFRKLQIVKALGDGPTRPMPAWVWRIGQALLVAHPNEAYSTFQVQLRQAFPDFAVAVMNVTGAEMGYLYPPELHGRDIYQVWQTPFSERALPALLEACQREAARLVDLENPSAAADARAPAARGSRA